MSVPKTMKNTMKIYYCKACKQWHTHEDLYLLWSKKTESYYYGCRGRALLRHKRNRFLAKGKEGYSYRRPSRPDATRGTGPAPICIPKDELYDMYITQCMTQAQIGEVFGLSSSVIAKKVKRYGIQREYISRGGQYDLFLTKELLYKEYIVNNKSQAQIAKEQKVSKSVIYKRIKKYGIVRDKACKQCDVSFTPKTSRHLYCSECSGNRRVCKEISTGHLGAWGELSITTDLIKRGWLVFKNVSPNGIFDLVIYRNDLMYKVEVKTVREYQRDALDNCDVLSKLKKAQYGVVDVLAMVIVETGEVIYKSNPGAVKALGVIKNFDEIMTTWK